MKNLQQLIQQKKMGNTDLFQINTKHYGSANHDKTLYCIYETGRNLGFFAMYRHWLEYLYFADICGYTPIICAGKDFVYREENVVAGTHNAFEYFFEQPSEVKVREVKHSNKVIFSNPVHREMVELIYTGKMNHYSYTAKYLQAMSEIVRKYLLFNNHTLSYIEQSIKKIGVKVEKVLGVHVRGTDFRGKYDNHPVFVTEKEYFDEIDRIYEKNGYSKIFVATDDQRTLDKFINQYGEKICYYHDVVRGSSNSSIAFSESSRKNHKYYLGLEVIRDMYTLSMCEGIIAGISQVAICAQINKLARYEAYEDIKIIDKGIYHNHRAFCRK